MPQQIPDCSEVVLPWEQKQSAINNRFFTSGLAHPYHWG